MLKLLFVKNWNILPATNLLEQVNRLNCEALVNSCRLIDLIVKPLVNSCRLIDLIVKPLVNSYRLISRPDYVVLFIEIRPPTADNNTILICYHITYTTIYLNILICYHITYTTTYLNILICYHITYTTIHLNILICYHITYTTIYLNILICYHITYTTIYINILICYHITYTTICLNIYSGAWLKCCLIISQLVTKATSAFSNFINCNV